MPIKINQCLYIEGSRNGVVAPEEDASMYHFIMNQNGFMVAPRVTLNGANILAVTDGIGVAYGHQFVISAEDIIVPLSTKGALAGRLIVHIDISNAENPIEFQVQKAATLPPLITENLLDGGTIHQIGVATFTVDTAQVAGLKVVAGTMTAHANNKANPHGVTAAQVGAATTSALGTTNTNLNAHTASRANPHVVTKAQVGLSAVTNTAQMPLSYWNWVGQGGQPTWLWGGNAQNQYNIYNPANFSVASAAYANFAARANNADTASHANAADWAVNASNASATATFGPSGRVSVNENSFFFHSTGKYHMTNYWNTAYNSVAAWAFEVVSTKEAKSDITEMPDGFGTGLLGAVPVTYDQKPQPPAKKERTAKSEPEPTPMPIQVGFTAEQMDDVFPEAVTYDEKTGKPAGINLYALITGTVALCQAQQVAIDTLKEQVDVLEKTILANGQKKENKNDTI